MSVVRAPSGADALLDWLQPRLEQVGKMGSCEAQLSELFLVEIPLYLPPPITDSTALSFFNEISLVLLILKIEVNTCK